MKMKKWHKQDISPAEVKSLASRFEMDLLTASILLRREITDPEDIKFFLEKDIRFLHNPFLFVEMEDAVDRIMTAVAEGEKVRVVGDRDVDGITSTAILVSTLKSLGLDVSYSVPEGDDPYGLTAETIEDFADQDGTLMITVDCGISNAKEVEYASTMGIDTIITDHHNPPEDLPPGVAILNPKLEDSGYPYPHLAGCAVVSKLVWALHFAKTEMYNRPVCLLHCRPGNGTVILDAVKLMNMVEIDRITENLVPGVTQLDKTRLGSFLVGQEIYVFESEVQERMLRQIFGNNADIALLDLAAEVWKEFPPLNGKGLFQLKEKSRMARYSEGEQGEIDVLINLFQTLFYKRESAVFDAYSSILDLVAIGTIADMMPLKDENRILVSKGLGFINQTSRRGLQELLLQQNLLSKKLTSTDIAWQVSPVINATGRLGVPSKAIELLLNADGTDVKNQAMEVIGLNKERRRLGETIWNKVYPTLQQSLEDMHEKLVFIFDPEINRGITGILAAKIVNVFNLPAFVLAPVDDKIVGSVRSPKGFNVKTFLEQFSDLFNDFGGHDCAAGFNIPKESLEKLKYRIKGAAHGLEPIEKAEEMLVIDAEVPKDYLTPDLMKVLDRFEPFGEDNTPLNMLTKGVRISAIELVGKTETQHVRMTISAGKHKWPAIFWNAAARVGDDIQDNEPVDIVYRLNRNFYQNKETLQLNILDIKL